MIKFCIALVCAIASLSGVAAAAERRYSVSDFEKIRLVGAATVIVETGRATTVRASGAPEVIDTFLVEVQDRVLTIQPRAGFVVNPGQRGTGPISIFVTMPLLNGAKLTGGGTLKIAELRGIEGNVTLTGSGQIDIARVAVDRLTARLSGSGTLTLAGKALAAEANITGAGSFAAADLKVADLVLMVASSGATKAAASRSAKITSTGAGSVEIIGAPSCTVQNLGSGTIACGEKP